MLVLLETSNERIQTHDVSPFFIPFPATEQSLYLTSDLTSWYVMLLIIL